MPPCLLILLCLLMSAAEAAAQVKEPAALVRLKEEIPLLEGREKAERLNQVARLYINAGVIKNDSGLVYARQAMEVAKQGNYRAAYCMATSLYAKVQLQFTNANEGLKYYRLTLKLAEELQDQKLTAIAYRGIGEALWYQNNFRQAIYNIDMSVQWFKQLGMAWEIADAINAVSNIYGDQGNYEKAFEGAREAYRIADSVHDKNYIVLSLTQIGYLYKSVGDFDAAMHYYQRAFNYSPHEGWWSYRHLSNRVGELYLAKQQFDSAYHFFKQSFTGNPDSKTSKLNMGNYYLALKKYDSALHYYSYLYAVLKRAGEGNISLYAMLGMSQVYLAKNDMIKALSYSREALQKSHDKSTRLVMNQACKLLSEIYEKLNRPDSAFHYYRQHVYAKDLMLTDQFKGKLLEYKRVAEDEKNLARIELLEKERLIDQQQLKENRLLRNILVGGILLLALLSSIIVWVISLKRKNEKLENERIHSELQGRADSLKMQALQAQMNPHFIFNCLSSINRFILKNESDKASDYLTRFSRLIRLVLINSQKSLIVLEEEIEMLRLYIEMERLRFKGAFDYSITYTNDIEPANVLIPPLLLQPFCENAIWHGLMHKEGPGHLSVEFEMRRGILSCIITDNGIGRAKAGELKSRSAEKLKSMGLKLTTERLALFNEDKSVHTSYKIEDIVNKQGDVQGTRVILEMRHKEHIGETA